MGDVAFDPSRIMLAPPSTTTTGGAGCVDGGGGGGGRGGGGGDKKRLDHVEESVSMPVVAEMGGKQCGGQQRDSAAQEAVPTAVIDEGGGVPLKVSK